MAGIGYELKKIFKEESILSLVRGITYSTVITIGPTVVVISTLIALYIVLGWVSISYYERELLASTILYGFIFSLLVTAPFNGIMSRYIADKIYEEEYDHILPSFYTGIFLNIIVASILGIPFILRVIFIGKVDPLFGLVSYLLYMSLVISFYTMIYLSATKDYKMIALFYIVGMLFAFGLANLLRYFGFSIINAILYGMTTGFLIIATLEFSYMKKYFTTNSGKYGDCLSYFRDKKDIWISNLFYILGLYVHNFVFWTHPSRITVAKSYISMQSYDMASFLAMFTNISTIILFTVMAETKFHTKYQKYNESVIGNTWQQIEMAKHGMFKLLVQQMKYILSIQFIITSTIFLIGILVFPKIGFSGQIFAIYPSLVAAFISIFTMYCNIIYMFYFNDQIGARYTSILFFIAVLAGSLVSINLSDQFYGMGAFFGAFIGWSFSYFRIRFIERNFDEHIFCKVDIIEQKSESMPSSVVYKSNSRRGV